jgi:hypothetical protein
VSTTRQRDATNNISVDIEAITSAPPYEKFESSSFKFIEAGPNYFQATEWTAKKSDDSDKTLKFYIDKDYGPGTHELGVNSSQLLVAYNQGGQDFGGNGHREKFTLTISQDKKNTRAEFDLHLLQFPNELIIRITGKFEFFSD